MSQQTQNICIKFVKPTLKTLGRRCTNVIQMCCVRWGVGRPTLLKECNDFQVIGSTISKLLTSRSNKIDAIHQAYAPEGSSEDIKHSSAELFFVSTMETKGFFQFEIIINVLVSSFRFI